MEKAFFHFGGQEANASGIPLADDIPETLGILAAACSLQIPLIFA